MQDQIEKTENAIAATKLADAATTAAKVVADAADEASLIAKNAVFKAAEAVKNQETGYVKVLSEALREVFGEHQESQRFIDVTRIPLICSNINTLNKNIESINNNITWIVRLIIGTVVLALLGLVLIK